MIYMMLADGFEETEALVPADMLRRCGIDFKTAGVNGLEICGAHSITVKADMTADEIDFDTVDGIILPGGMPGTENLRKNPTVTELVKHCANNKLMLGAICAAPSILGELGYLDGAEAVCYPGFEESLKGAKVLSVPVARHENIITARGAGCAFEFGREIIDYLGNGRLGGSAVLNEMIYPFV